MHGKGRQQSYWLSRGQCNNVTRIPMAHVFSMARFHLGSHGLRVDRGRWKGGQHMERGADAAAVAAARQQPS
jgi:hypothetical protein